MREIGTPTDNFIRVTSAQHMLNSINNLRFAGVATALICLTGSLPISKLCIGFVYKDQCPMQTMLPIWLITSGLRGLFCMIVTLSIMNFTALTDRRCVKTSSNLLIIVGLLIVGISAFFNFAWSILGIFWSLSKRSTVQHNDPTQTDTYCQSTPYLFVIVMAIIQMVVIVVFLVIAFVYIRRHLLTFVTATDSQRPGQSRKPYRLYVVIFILSIVFLI